MDDKRSIHSLDDIFNDPDSATLLVTKKQPMVNSFDPDIERLKEVQKWVRDHGGKEPEKVKDPKKIQERKLASWLIGVREDADRIAFLKPYDKMGLLKEKVKKLPIKRRLNMKR